MFPLPFVLRQQSMEGGCATLLTAHNKNSGFDVARALLAIYRLVSTLVSGLQFAMLFIALPQRVSEVLVADRLMNRFIHVVVLNTRALEATEKNSIHHPAAK